MDLLKELKKYKDDIICTKSIKGDFTLSEIIWDDYDELSSYLDKLYDNDEVEDIFFYTLLVEDEYIRIVKGCSYMKRLGYILMKKDMLDIDEEGIEVTI